MLTAVGAIAPMAAESAVIMTQPPGFSFGDIVHEYALNRASWTNITALVETQHTIEEHADFSDYGVVSSYDVIWVDQNINTPLSATEINNLQTYFTTQATEALFIMDMDWVGDTYFGFYDHPVFAQNIVDWLADDTTKKMVFIGENDAWQSWNESILSVVGGGVEENYNGFGTAISSHPLAAGVDDIFERYGATLNETLGDPDILFDSNFAAVYTSDLVDGDAGGGGSAALPASAWLLALGLIPVMRRFRVKG